MRPRLRLLVIPLLLAMLWPAAALGGQTEPLKKPHSAAADRAEEEKLSDAGSHEAADKMQRHRQKSIQRRLPEQVRTGAHDSEVRQDPPPDVFESPEAKAADHIPKPLPSDEVRPAPPPKVSPTLKQAPRVKSKIERAWALYDRKRYQAAADLFDEVVKANPHQALNARMGLAYSRLKQGRQKAAIAELDYLVHRKYRLNETLPLLLDLMAENGEFETARRYLHLLPESQKKLWLGRVLEGNLIGQYHQLKAASPPATAADWAAFIEQNRRALDRCIRPDIFFEAATKLDNLSDRAQATAVSYALLDCKLAPDFRLGIVDHLSGLLGPDDAIRLLREEKGWFQQAAPGYLSKIERLEINALKRRLVAQEKGSAKHRATAETILALDASDPDARAVIAWSDFEQKRYEQSETHFEVLWRGDPGNRDYALGLGYSRLNLGRYDDALEPLEGDAIADDDRTLELKSLVYKARAREAYEQKNWQSAGDNLETALEIDPGDTDSKMLLAWTRFQENRRQEALALMESVYAQDKSAAAAGALLDLYESGPETGRSWHLASEMADSRDSDSRQKAADYLFSHGAPVSADQIKAVDKDCYSGAAAPRGEVFFYHQNKSGDSGTSQLAETALPINGTYPVDRGLQWSLSVTPRYLSSGNAPDAPYAGKFYRFLNGAPQSNDLVDSLWVWQPELGFQREGRVGLSANLGTSPIGGTVGPTPTLGVGLSFQNWHANLHRSVVKDSILSYTGLEDPYSSRKWGRVLRNGISAGATWPLFEDYWISASGSYELYTGEHLWDNNSAHFNAATGRTFDYNGDELTLGIFFTAQHYRRNSDFYTYGHGGYYSPELMTLIGPFFRYRSSLCRTYWFDVQLSTGWLHQELDDSPVYPLFNGNVAGFTPAAAANARADYEGDTDNKLGASAKIQGMKLITDQLAAGGFAGIDNNADFTRWQVGVGLQFFFEPQKAFWQRRDFFTDFGAYSNR